jgi:predicted nucleotidyltransferase
MNADELIEALRYRQNERQQLLQACQALLHQDDRIEAVWLFGSSSRQSSDALSDLDLWTVVNDHAISELIAARRDYVEQLGPALFCLESPRNAPAGGAYLMALYPGAYGPQQIDWYWQPASTSCLPNDALLLFERQSLVRCPDRSTLDLVAGDQDAPNTVQQRASFFWAMSCICAKKIARHNQESAFQILQMLSLALHDCQVFLNKAKGQSLVESEPALDRDAQFQLLIKLVSQMEAYNPLIFADDDPITTSFVEQFRAFLTLCQALSITPKPLV